MSYFICFLILVESKGPYFVLEKIIMILFFKNVRISRKIAFTQTKESHFWRWSSSDPFLLHANVLGKYGPEPSGGNATQ